MTDITIPEDVAKDWSERLRGPLTLADRAALADLLDPPATSLRDRVASALAECITDASDWDDEADAALAVIADAVEVLPVNPYGYLSRAAVLVLLRGTQ